MTELHRKFIASRLVVLCALGASFACSETDGGSEEASVPNWALVEELRIGSLDDPDQAVTSIRPLGLAVGPSGQIFVAQAQAGNIREYDSEGDFVRIIGGRGRGPGEFNSLGPIGILDDTLYAINQSPGRLSLFSVTGEHLNTTNMAFPPPTPYHIPTAPFRLFPDGTGVVSPLALSEAYARGDLETTEYLRIDQSGRLVDTLLSHSEPAQLAIPLSSGGVISMSHPMPQAPMLAFSHDGSRLAVVERKAARSAGAEFRITELTLEGDTIHSAGVSYRPVPIPPEVVDSIHASVTAAATRVLGAEGEDVVRGALQLPGHYPPATQALYAENLDLWIRREDQSGTVDHWEVYAEGERIARVDVPRGFAVHLIHHNALWGVEADEFAVPYVVRYRIVKQDD